MNAETAKETSWKFGRNGWIHKEIMDVGAVIVLCPKLFGDDCREPHFW